MKTIVESIKESIVINESTFPTLDVLTFERIVNGEIGEDEWSDYGFDKLNDKYLDIIRNHCAIIPAAGGYNGDGRDCIDSLERLNIDVKTLIGDKKYQWYKDGDEVDVYDVLGGELSPEALKACSKAVKIKPRYGAAYWCAGYESPAIIIFDVKNNITKDIVDKLEEFS